MQTDWSWGGKKKRKKEKSAQPLQEVQLHRLPGAPGRAGAGPQARWDGQSFAFPPEMRCQGDRVTLGSSSTPESQALHNCDALKSAFGGNFPPFCEFVISRIYANGCKSPWV